MYSRGQKKKKHITSCYSYTYHRRKMKLGPFFMVKCPYYRYVNEESLGGCVYFKNVRTLKISILTPHTKITLNINFHEVSTLLQEIFTIKNWADFGDLLKSEFLTIGSD